MQKHSNSLDSLQIQYTLIWTDFISAQFPNFSTFTGKISEKWKILLLWFCRNAGFSNSFQLKHFCSNFKDLLLSGESTWEEARPSDTDGDNSEISEVQIFSQMRLIVIRKKLLSTSNYWSCIWNRCVLNEVTTYYIIFDPEHLFFWKTNLLNKKDQNDSSKLICLTNKIKMPFA